MTASIRSAWLVVIVVACPRAAIADDNEDKVWEWKDGCPAYFPPEDAPKFTPDIKTHDGSAGFGALPALDSPLGSTRVATEVWRSTLRPQPRIPSPVEFGNRTYLQVNSTSGLMVGASVAGYDVYDEHHLGNFSWFGGYRHTNYMLGPMFRSGIAIRLAGGGPLSAENGSFTGEREQVAAHSPFREPSFGVDQPWTVSVEYRVEMVGCRAPFIDVRIDGSRWRLADNQPTQMAVPIEIALGAYPVEWLALYGAIGEDLRSTQLQFRQLTRVSFGVEGQWLDNRRLRVGAHASAFSGHDVEGWELGLSIAFVVPWWKGVLE